MKSSGWPSVKKQHFSTLKIGLPQTYSLKFYRSEVSEAVRKLLIDHHTVALEGDHLVFNKPRGRYYEAFGIPVMKFAIDKLNRAIQWHIFSGAINPNDFGGRLEELFQSYLWCVIGLTIPRVYIFHTLRFTAWHTEFGFLGSVCLLPVDLEAIRAKKSGLLWRDLHWQKRIICSDSCIQNGIKTAAAMDCPVNGTELPSSVCEKK